jgi:membrane-bound ClpP family serine protease
MDIHQSRTWIIFYLISFVLLLFALFLTSEGVLLGIGLIMVIIVVGVNLAIITTEMKKAAKKREIMERISKIEPEKSGKGTESDALSRIK